MSLLNRSLPCLMIVAFCAAWAEHAPAQAAGESASQDEARAGSLEGAFTLIAPENGTRILLIDPKSQAVAAGVDVEEVREVLNVGWLAPDLFYSESSAGRFAVYFDLWDVATDHLPIKLRKRILVIGGYDCSISPDLHHLACRFAYDDSVNEFILIADTTRKEHPDDLEFEDPRPFRYPDDDALLEGGEPLDTVRFGLDEWVEIPTGPPFALRIVEEACCFHDGRLYLRLEAGRRGEFPMVGSTTYWGQCFMSDCHLPDGQLMRFANYRSGESFGIKFEITNPNAPAFCIDTVRMLLRSLDGSFRWDPSSNRLTAFETVGGREYQLEFVLGSNGQWETEKIPLKRR